MPRADLLALTPDDLATITNRGVVKRAQREVEAGDPSCTVEEQEGGELVFAWSDGVVCRFPAGGTIREAVCSSGVGVTRHVVRSVLAYQQRQHATPSAHAGDTTAAPRPAATPTGWDPGAISDADLERHFRKPAVARARKRFEEGVLVEVARSVKPTARFLDEPCTVRFQVPGDLRYVAADCAEPALATFIPLAVWSFRLLPSDRTEGLIAAQQREPAVPSDRLNEMRALLRELCIDGVSGASATWPHRWQRLEQGFRDAGLVWPAELAADLHQQEELYRSRDARFDPVELVPLLGELVLRARAIERPTKELPQFLVRGSTGDRTTEIAGSRFVGLGVGVRAGRKTATLSAYLQDADTGSVAAVERTFADADEGAPKPFAELAMTMLTKGVALRTLGGSQLLLKAGKRTPSGRLILPRGSTSYAAHPQGFTWEQLRPPVGVDGFATLAARLKALPPTFLRPRRTTENLHVVPAERAEAAAYDPVLQRLTATLRDRHGGTATLVQPYHGRAMGGFDALAAALQLKPASIRFVSGHVSLSPQGILVRPVCVVMEAEGRRIGLQPWVDDASATAAPFAQPTDADAAAATGPGDYLRRTEVELSETLLTGLRRSGEDALRRWRSHAERGRRLGFVRLVGIMDGLAAQLTQKAELVDWDAAPAAETLLDLCALFRIAAELTC